MKSSMKIAFNLVVVIIPCETEKELKWLKAALF
jgi:hypothetical protein